MDFDIHGIVGIRLVNPQKSDIKFLSEKLGKFNKPLNREPDIIFNFTKKIDIPSFTYLGLTAIFTEDSFFAVSRKENLLMKIPFETFGEKSEYLIESGCYDIPWLFDIINFTFLKKNYIPIHATAFKVNDTGIMIIGWSKGGKTESLLAFANHGAHYIGDEWIILSNDGNTIFGIPVPICIWEWQFENIPRLLPKTGLQQKVLYKFIHFLDLIHKGLKKFGFEKSFLSSILNKAMPIFNQQLNIRVNPEKIFKSNQLNTATLDKIILSFSHNDSEYKLEKSDYLDLVKHAYYSNSYEQSEFLNLYKEYKFAFPDSKNDFLEDLDNLQYTLLKDAFKNKETYIFKHPYPMKFEDMYNKLKHLV